MRPLFILTAGAKHAFQPTYCNPGAICCNRRVIKASINDPRGIPDALRVKRSVQDSESNSIGVDDIKSPEDCNLRLIEEVSEVGQSSDIRRIYTVDNSRKKLRLIEEEKLPSSSSSKRQKSSSFTPQDILLRLLRASVLPAGWPESVTSDYASFAFWNVARQIFRQANYVLGTSSLLLSLGLGSKEAITLGATLNWVLKDGLGMATKVAISSTLASFVDKDPKHWRFVGDSLMAVSALIEILSVTRPQYFLLFGTTAALIRQGADAMSGPSYRVFLDSFAIDSNIGDVSSRSESQVVIGKLLGLGLGVLTSSILSHVVAAERLDFTLASYAVLAATHLFSTFNGCRVVQLRTLNWQRLHLVIDDFLKNGCVPRIIDVNVREDFLYTRRMPPREYAIEFGAQLGDYFGHLPVVGEALSGNNRRYLLSYDGRKIGVVLHKDSDCIDSIYAALQARWIFAVTSNRALTQPLSQEQINEVLSESYEWISENCNAFHAGLRKEGWSLTKLLLPAGKSRFSVSGNRGDKLMAFCEGESLQ